MCDKSFNALVLLGPTAVGKTAIGVRLAHRLGMEIVSADSRQVYKGLDIGSGKDLAEYTITVQDGSGGAMQKQIPYHLIDCATLDSEYTVFSYQQDFYRVFSRMQERGVSPLIVGGTGMYLDSVLRGYDFMPVPENAELRAELEKKTLPELGEMLLSLRPALHNKSDLLLRDRVVRAIEIALFMKSEECAKLRERQEARPKIRAFVLGTTLEREELRKNIDARLKLRLFGGGLIEEVENLHGGGVPWERLEKLGLEYRFVSEYLEGIISTKEDLYTRLYHAICQFAKRQETWFRGMEKKGVAIHWLPRNSDRNVRYTAALSLLDGLAFTH